MSASRTGRKPWGTYLLYVVAVGGFLYLFIPLFTIVQFSFNEQKGKRNTEWNAFTFDNWAHAFKSSDYIDALQESLKVAAVACTLATVLGALVALAITRYKMKGGPFINMMLVIPLTTPEIVMGASLFTLFFNQDVERGFATIVVAHTLFCVSFVALTVKARLRGLDWSLEDAAADLGSGPLRTFTKITMPIITPGIAAAFLLSLALSIDDYIVTSFVAGNVSTLPREIFDSSRVEIPAQIHVIASMIMFVAIAIILIATMAGNRRKARLG
ncbi:MAG: ABC transporter permease [Actinomycetota bacterium]|nr:ABC transporter permease [Actinomycetota bacterium]